MKRIFLKVNSKFIRAELSRDRMILTAKQFDIDINDIIEHKRGIAFAQ